jgi:hypothetical protein
MRDEIDIDLLARLCLGHTLFQDARRTDDIGIDDLNHVLGRVRRNDH